MGGVPPRLCVRARACVRQCSKCFDSVAVIFQQSGGRREGVLEGGWCGCRAGVRDRAAPSNSLISKVGPTGSSIFWPRGRTLGCSYAASTIPMSSRYGQSARVIFVLLS